MPAARQSGARWAGGARAGRMIRARAMRVLLVEDEASDAGLLTVLLRIGRGAAEIAEPEVDWVRTLSEARRRGEAEAPDVVLLDLSLPDSTGVGAVRTLRTWFPLVPVIVLTGRDDPDLAVQSIEAGAQDYLVKGDFEPRDLARAIRHACVRARLESRLRLQEIALNAAPSAIAIGDAANRIEWANPAFTRLTGHALDEALGRRLDELAGMSIPPTALDHADAALAARRQLRGERSGQRSDGSAYLAQFEITPVIDADGRVRHLVTVQRDITEHKRSEAVLQAINTLQNVGGGMGSDPRNRCARMLALCMDLSDSPLGFIGEVRHRDTGAPYLQVHAVAGIGAMNGPAGGTAAAADLAGTTQPMDGLEITRIDSLFGSVLASAQPVIRNDAGGDPRDVGLPPGHPAIQSFAGLPVVGAGEFVAVVGLANRRGGYPEAVTDALKPLLAAFGSAIADQRIKQSLSESQQRLATLVASMQEMLIVLDAGGRVLECHVPASEAFEHAFADPALGHFRDVLPESFAARLESAIDGVRQDGRVRHFEHTVDGAHGRRHFHATVNRLIDAGAVPEGFLAVVRDVTLEVQSESSLRIAATAFESQECMLITDATRAIRSVNPAFTRTTGYSADDVVGHPLALFDPRQHDAEFIEAVWDCAATYGSWQGEIQARRKNGDAHPAWLAVTVVRDRDDAVSHFVCSLTDITERKAAEERIRYLAFYDLLTQLPNRRLLMDRLEHALATRRHTGREGALFIIDLDHFKNLNDTLGHDTGDRLLEHTALRIVSCVRDSDTVARVGGDEFVVMLEDLSTAAEEAAAQAEVIAQKILVSLNQPYTLGEHAHHITPSIGVTLFSDLVDTVDEVLKRADMAMYQAKAAGRNTIRFFDPAMQAAIEARSMLETDLRHALTVQEFALHFQPQVTIDGRVIGAEALLRWPHPTRGLIPPDRFIPLAEDSAIILALGHWVLEQACAQLRSWSRDPATAAITLAVNVSARQFRHPGFVDQVLDTLTLSGVAPQRLKLELTESLLLDDIEAAAVTMTTLKRHGVGFALDDFGTGYSSLVYLKRLPLDQLKIDRSFVRDILTDPNDEVIARTIVALGHSLGLDVIAEGVETPEQLAVLGRLGCAAFQGYLFGRPQPAEAFDAGPRMLALSPSHQ
ncbi:MAG: EAL domain-containing protein [Rhodocyclaceae bacterium]